MAIHMIYGAQNVGKTSFAYRVAPNALGVTTPGGVANCRSTLRGGIGITPKHIMPWAAETQVKTADGKSKTLYPIDAIISNLTARYGTLQSQYDAKVNAAKAKNASATPLPKQVCLDGAMVPAASAMSTSAIWIMFPSAEPEAVYGYTVVIIDDLKLIINGSRAMWSVTVVGADGVTATSTKVDDLDQSKRKELGREIGSVVKNTFVKWLDSLNTKFPGVDFIITSHEASDTTYNDKYTPGGPAWETKAGAYELAAYMVTQLRITPDFVDADGNAAKYDARKKHLRQRLVRSPIERFSSAASAYVISSVMAATWSTKDKDNVYFADDIDTTPAAVLGTYIGLGKREAHRYSYAGFEFIEAVVNEVLAAYEKDSDIDTVEKATAAYAKVSPRREGMSSEELDIWLCRRDWAVHEAWAATLARSRLHERLK